MSTLELAFMVVGFSIASYSVVANDAIQTLGTFLASNSKRPWWVLWLFGGSILAAVLLYGWFSQGDVSYGRLSKYPLPDPFTWIYVVPPLVLLALTRFGVPVSTTFLILTMFRPKNLGPMVVKSLMGYALAFVVAIVIYFAISRLVEKRFLESARAGEEVPSRWLVLQWLSTGFLWSQWLIQDLANIFVYLPRDLTFGWVAFGLVIMLGLLGHTFYRSGGEIQKVVTSKTNTEDIRSATVVNFLFALVLLFFKEWSKLPMSTTWVFLGLLAGREIAMTVRLGQRPMKETIHMVAADGAKLVAGLVVSVIIAVGLPLLAG